MSKIELLFTMLVNDCVLNWKPIFPYLNGFAENFIAAAEI